MVLPRAAQAGHLRPGTCETSVSRALESGPCEAGTYRTSLHWWSRDRKIAIVLRRGVLIRSVQRNELLDAEPLEDISTEIERHVDSLQVSDWQLE